MTRKNHANIPAHFDKRLINKQTKKKIEKICHLCGENDYSLLDTHRILEGSQGGRYTDYNTLILCSNCHRKIHAGKYKILGKYYTTAAKYVVQYLDTETGQEYWI